MQLGELEEICRHENCPPQWAKTWRIYEPCHLIRLCRCGAKAGCPAACGYQRDEPCACERYIKGDYCPRCGAQKLMVDWTHTYIQQRWCLVCDHCRHGFPDTVGGRWRIKKFRGTNFSKGKPIEEILNPHNVRAYLKRLRALAAPHSGETKR